MPWESYRPVLERLRQAAEHTPLERWFVTECYEPLKLLVPLLALALFGMGAGLLGIRIRNRAEREERKAWLTGLTPAERLKREKDREKILRLAAEARRELEDLKRRIVHRENRRLPSLREVDGWLAWVEKAAACPEIYLDSRHEETGGGLRLALAHFNLEEGPWQEALFRLSDFLDDCGRAEAVHIRRIRRRSGERGVREYKKKKRRG